MSSAPLPPMPSFVKAPPMPAFVSTSSSPEAGRQGGDEEAARAVGSATEVPMTRRSVAQAGRLGRLMDGLTPNSTAAPEPWVPMAESALRAATLRGFPAVAAALGLWLAARQSGSAAAVAYAEAELAAGLAASPEFAASTPEMTTITGVSAAATNPALDISPAVALPQEQVGLLDRVLLGRLDMMRALDGAVGLSDEQEPVVRDLLQRIGVMAAGRQDPRDIPGLDFMLSSVILDLQADHGPLAEKLSAWQKEAVGPAKDMLRVAHIRKRASLGFSADLGVAPPTARASGIRR